LLPSLNVACDGVACDVLTCDNAGCEGAPGELAATDSSADIASGGELLANTRVPEPASSRIKNGDRTFTTCCDRDAAPIRRSSTSAAPVAEGRTIVDPGCGKRRFFPEYGAIGITVLGGPVGPVGLVVRVGLAGCGLPPPPWGASRGAVPEPVSAIAFGPDGSLEVIVTAPTYDVTPVGRNVTVTVHKAPVPRGKPQSL
jgi:hypothetical protein